VACAWQPHVVAQPRPGWHEHSADDWWIATVEALREIAAQIDVRRLAGVSVAHQRETFVPVDADGRPLRDAILWMDDRAAAFLSEIEAVSGGDRLHQRTGQRLSRNLTIAKIRLGRSLTVPVSISQDWRRE
jgi:xylulokinase